MMGDRISCKRHRDTSYDQKHAVSGQECDGRLLYPLGTAPLEKTSTFCNLYVISPAFALLYISISNRLSTLSLGGP